MRRWERSRSWNCWNRSAIRSVDNEGEKREGAKEEGEGEREGNWGREGAEERGRGEGIQLLAYIHSWQGEAKGEWLNAYDVVSLSLLACGLF